MKKVIYFSFFVLFTSQVFGQKNQFSLYYNYNPNESVSKVGAIGGRYSREVYPKLSAAVGLDYEIFYHTLDQSSRLRVYDIATGALLFDKSVGIDYDSKVNTFTFDALLYYNLLHKDSKLTLSPFVGVSQRLFKITNIPLIEVLNYEIVQQEETKETKYYTFPKAGLAFSYHFGKKFSIGSELFYRAYLGGKSSVLFSNKSTSNTIEGTEIFDDEGRSTILSYSNAESNSSYRFFEKMGFSLALTYTF